MDNLPLPLFQTTMGCNVNLSIEQIKHMSSAHVVVEKSTYRCVECDGIFESIEKYHLHLLSHVEKVNGGVQNSRFVKHFKCDKCGEKFVQKSTLETHKTVHKPFPHICFCGIGYYIKSDLLQHTNLVHSDKLNTELQKLTFRKQRALKNEFWTPKVNYTGPKLKESPDLTPQPRAPRPRLKAELVVKSNFTKDKNVDTGKTYTCEICGQTLASLSSLKRHLKKHPEYVKKFSCRVCGDKIASQSDLNAHMLSHGEKPFTCSICHRGFKYPSKVTKHQRIHMADKQMYQCDICGKKLSTPTTLKLHVLRHAGYRTFHCDVCRKSFYNRSELALHARTHTGEQPYACSSCGKKFSDPSAFNRHKRTHSGVKPYECKFCGMKFSDASGKIAHEKRHKGKRDFKCELCNRKFYNRTDLYNHKTTVHDGTKKYECDHCFKTFALKGYLMIHMKAHLSAHEFECDYCGFKTNFKTNLIRHIQSVHLKLTKCECQECGFRFLHSSQLKRHAVVHKHNHLFYLECDTCKRRFSSKNDLYRHMVSRHLNIKCASCRKAFCSKNELKEHKLKGCTPAKPKSLKAQIEKNEACHICLKRFTSIRSLKVHFIRAHIYVCKEYICDYCGQRFSHSKNKKNYLREHIFKEHLNYLYCNVCRGRFHSTLELNQHKKSNGCETERFLCQICDEVFNSRHELSKHLTVHCEKDIVVRCERIPLLQHKVLS